MICWRFEKSEEMIQSVQLGFKESEIPEEPSAELTHRQPTSIPHEKAHQVWEALSATSRCSKGRLALEGAQDGRPAHRYAVTTTVLMRIANLQHLVLDGGTGKLDRLETLARRR